MDAREVSVDPDAFVYILKMGIADSKVLQYQGLRNGVVVGDGRHVLTAAHCVNDFENTDHSLFRPLIVSPYYGDLFEARIAAIDQQSDMALLEVDWDAHPALQVEADGRWRRNRSLSIIGYPPPAPCRGGNGSLSRSIMAETVRLRDSGATGRSETRVGPVKFPGKGWSGSPIVNPDTGCIVGILKTEKYLKEYHFLKRHYIYSGSYEALRTLTDEHIPAMNPADHIQTSGGKQRFDQILTLLDSFQAIDQESCRELAKNLYPGGTNSAGLYMLAGWAFIGQKEEEPYYQKALERAPRSTLIRSFLANHLLWNNRPAEAAEQFNIIYEQDPDHLFACHGMLAALVLTDPAAAEPLGRDLTKRWPENAALWFEYAKALRACNKRELELEAMRKATGLCDEVSYQYRRYLADALMANQLLDDAEESYNTLLKTHECEQCWLAFASLQLSMGPDHGEKAREAIEKAKAFNPNPDKLPEIYKIYNDSLQRLCAALDSR